MTGSSNGRGQTARKKKLRLHGVWGNPSKKRNGNAPTGPLIGKRADFQRFG